MSSVLPRVGFNVSSSPEKIEENIDDGQGRSVVDTSLSTRKITFGKAASTFLVGRGLLL